MDVGAVGGLRLVEGFGWDLPIRSNQHPKIEGISVCDSTILGSIGIRQQLLREHICRDKGRYPKIVVKMTTQIDAALPDDFEPDSLFPQAHHCP